MAGRTHLKHVRAYASGLDISGRVRDVGPLGIVFDAEAEAAMSDTIKHVMGGQGQASIMMGTINSWLEAGAGNMHEKFAAPGSKHSVLVAIGQLTAPAAGDPVFAGEWYQDSYIASEGSHGFAATLEFGEYAADADSLLYDQAWGELLHPNGAETAANGGTADVDGGGQTAAGGIGVLMVLAGDGTCTFTIEHSAVDADANFDSTGAVVTFDTTDASSPFGEVKALDPSTTVEQYLRWQIALGTATTVTFVMAFIRGT